MPFRHDPAQKLQTLATGICEQAMPLPSGSVCWRFDDGFAGDRAQHPPGKAESLSAALLNDPLNLLTVDVLSLSVLHACQDRIVPESLGGGCHAVRTRPWSMPVPLQRSIAIPSTTPYCQLPFPKPAGLMPIPAARGRRDVYRHQMISFVVRFGLLS